MATPDPIPDQQCAIYNYKESAIRAMDGVRTTYIPTESTREMEDSQRIPCNTTISICGDGGVWGKFHRTTTRSHRRRTRMGSREDSGVKTTWTKEGIAASHQVEGVQRSAQLLGTSRQCACSRTT